MKMNQKVTSPCTCLNMRRASNAITDMYDTYLKPSGLSISQFSILKHISLMAPVSVSEESAVMRLDRTTLVRNLRPLEERGLIQDIAEKGTRNRQLALTDKGKESYQQAEMLWQQAQMAMDNFLGEEEVGKLTELLSKIEAFKP